MATKERRLTLIKNKLLLALFLFGLFLSFIPTISFANTNQTVYVISVKDTVEKGLSEYIDRAVTTAEENNAAAIIFEINTPGGAIDAATAIGKRISETNIKTISFINQDAISAGSFIALNTDQIYMTEGSRIGAAGVIDGQGNTADEKAQSYWLYY